MLLFSTTLLLFEDLLYFFQRGQRIKTLLMLDVPPAYKKLCWLSYVSEAPFLPTRLSLPQQCMLLSFLQTHKSTRLLFVGYGQPDTVKILVKNSRVCNQDVARQNFHTFKEDPQVASFIPATTERTSSIQVTFLQVNFTFCFLLWDS